MRLHLLLGLLFSAIVTIAQTPDFSMYGYATLNGGTTGGAAGEVVTPTTFAELVTYVEDPTTPYTILITKEFNTEVTTYVDASGAIVESTASGAIETTFGDVLKIGSNKTLLGVGDAAFFNRIGLVVQCQSNIIIRNIKFTMMNVPATVDDEYKILDTDGVTTIGDPDCIAMQADDDDLAEADRISRNIWIDHCEFYNEDPASVYSKDRYDGLVDMKNDVQYVTISWCYFHDHSKACLSGKGSSDQYDRKTTMHHNKFTNIESRMPLLRSGYLHFTNNYIKDCPDGNGVNVRINSNVYVDYNYFDNVKKPIFGKPSENGAANMSNNVFADCSRLPSALMPCTESPDADALSSDEEVLVSTYVPEYLATDESDVINAVADVPTMVNTYCGVGVIGTDLFEVTSSITAGTGTIELSPTGGVYAEGTEVTATAVGEIGYAIDSWGGDVSGTEASVTFTVNADMNITAAFKEVPTYTLTVTETGNGSVTIDPEATIYSAGDVVTLTAVPDSKMILSTWGGDASGSETTIEITMDANKTVSATFIDDPDLVGKYLIAYVTDPSSDAYANDTKIYAALVANDDFAVTEVDGTVSGNDYSDYDLVIYSEVLGSSANGSAELEGINKPFLMMKVHAYKSAVWNWASSGYDQDATATNIEVLNADHAIFDGVTLDANNEVQILSAVNEKGLTYMNPNSFTSVSGGTVAALANVSGSSTNASILEIPVGTTINGTTLTQPFVQIGINAASFANVTDAGVQIIENTCYYLMENTIADDATSIGYNTSDNSITCYPTVVNASTSVYVSVDSSEDVNVSLVSLTGQVVSKEKKMVGAGTNKLDVDMQMCQTGIYIIIVKCGAQVSTFKVIKN